MIHLPTLINDLAVILAAAAISTLLFRKLRQPIVLGYLIAGFAVGPHFQLWPTVVDRDGVQLWAEIGARNPRFKQILEHFEAYRGDQQAWFRVAEDSFAIAMAQLQQQPR